MKTLKDFYEEKKKQAHTFPTMLYSFSKPKYREPLNAKQQGTLNKYIKQIYNPRFRKLKEAEHFREEWMEPETGAIKTQA